MDALPMDDRKTVPYASVHPGIAHAAVTMAILLSFSCAHLFSKLSDSVPGNVKLIFQPSEDTTPVGRCR